MWAAAQPGPAISGCSQSYSRVHQNQLPLVQLCNQPCILWLGSFLTPRAVFTCRGMLCVKHSCSAHSAVLRQDSLGSTSHMEWVPPRCFPALMKLFFQFPGFLRTLTLLHKSRVSLGLSSLYWDVVYFQSVSFLPAHFFFLTLEQQSSVFSTAAKATESASMLLQKNRILSQVMMDCLEGKGRNKTAVILMELSQQAPNTCTFPTSFHSMEGVMWNALLPGQPERLCWKSWWKYSFKPPVFSCSPANSCLDVWRYRQTGRPGSPECLFSQDLWHGLQQ